MGVGDVAVYILDLRQVLLRHVHQLGGAHLIGQPREALVKRRRVVLLVVVLLQGGWGGVEESSSVGHKAAEEAGHCVAMFILRLCYVFKAHFR